MRCFKTAVHWDDIQLCRHAIATKFICSGLPLRRDLFAPACHCDEIYLLRPAIATKYNCTELPVHRLGLHRVPCDEMVLRRLICNPVATLLATFMIAFIESHFDNTRCIR